MPIIIIKFKKDDLKRGKGNVDENCYTISSLVYEPQIKINNTFHVKIIS